MQNAADQAALAAATQLDGKVNACSRAASAASGLIRNDARFANDGGNLAVTIQNESSCDRTGFIKFYKNKDRSDTGTLTDADANFVEVTVNSRTARFALTPIVSVLSSGALSAKAYAGVGSAICKVPPVMICNPDEPSDNSDENYAFNPTRGVGLKLITGNADAPGNFGWLEATFANGANGLGAALGYDTVQADCQQTDGVTTKTGMSTSVLDSLNTRFDVYANGNTCRPNMAESAPRPAIRARTWCALRPMEPPATAATVSAFQAIPIDRQPWPLCRRRVAQPIRT